MYFWCIVMEIKYWIEYWIELNWMMVSVRVCISGVRGIFFGVDKVTFPNFSQRKMLFAGRNFHFGRHPKQISVVSKTISPPILNFHLPFYNFPPCSSPFSFFPSLSFSRCSPAPQLLHHWRAYMCLGWLASVWNCLSFDINMQALHACINQTLCL